KAAVAWQEAMTLGGDEGQAAGLRLGELKLLGPTADANEGLAIWAKAIEKTRTPNEYQNQVLQLSRARQLLEKACRHFLDAKDFPRAAVMLDKFVRHAKDEGRLAEAWLSLAEASLAQGNKHKARTAYYKCIEFPLTPFAYRARYQLALEEIAAKNYSQALAIL